MALTRKGRRTNADKNNTETPCTPGGANGTPHTEDEASSHLSQREEVPVPPPPPQPSVRSEPSPSLGCRARPTRSAALQMVWELLGHPPAPEGHASWIARIQELADIAGELPPVSQGANAGQPKSVRAP